MREPLWTFSTPQIYTKAELLAGPSLHHKFTPKPSYWVAAGEVGSVLDTEIPSMITAEVVFPLNVFSMKATLEKYNTWTIEKTIMEDAETDD